MKKIFLFAFVILLVPIIQAASIQVSSGTDPLVVDLDSPCVFTSSPLTITCIDQNTGQTGNTVTIDPTLTNIDGQKSYDRAAIVGESGEDLKVFVVDKLGQGINFPISAAGKQSNPKIAFNPADKQIGIVWQDKRSGQDDIYFQVYSLTGNPIFSEIQVTASAQDETNPGIVYDPDFSKYTIVYHNSTDNNLYFKEFDKTGAPVPTIDQLVSTETGARNFPELEERKGNDLIYVLYEDSRQGLGKDIYLTKIKEGATITPDKPISTSTEDERLPESSYNTKDSELGIVFQEGGNISFASFDISWGLTHFSKKNIATGTNPSIAYLNKSGLYFVAYQNGNNIQGLFLKQDGAEATTHSLISVPVGFEVFDLTGKKLNQGFQSFSNVPVLIKHPTLGPVAGATLGFSETNIDLSSAKIGVSGEGAVYLDLSSIIGLTNPTAYLQNTNSDSGIVICPEATSVNDTSEGCSGQRTITAPGIATINQNRIEVSSIVLDSKNYYEIKGLSSGGAVLVKTSKISLDLFDETKFLQRLPNQEAKFFAFYTENDLPITNANCEIEFDTDPSGTAKKSQMIFDQNSNLYTKTAKFGSEGDFVYTVKCSIGNKTKASNSTFKIGAQTISNNPPVITKIEPSGEVGEDTTTLTCTATDDKGLSEIKILFGPNLGEVKKESFYRQEKEGTAQYSATLENDNKWQCIAKDINGEETKSAELQIKKNKITGLCQEDWGCSDWSEPTNQCGTRTCTDKNNCGTEKNKPLASLDCPKPPEKGFDFGSILLPLIIIVVVLIAALVGYTFWKNKSSKPITDSEYETS